MSGGPDLQRRNRRAIWWTIGGVTAIYGITVLMVMGVLSLANRYPPAAPSPSPSAMAAGHTAAQAERRNERLAAAETGSAALPDWVERRRLQDSAAPWRLDDQGRVVWVRP